MDLSPGTLTMPLSGPPGEKDFGVGMAAAFDSGAALWQGAPLAGFDPVFLILLKGFEAHGEA